MSSKIFSILIIAAALAALLNCSPIQEPWVRSGDHLQNERMRSSDQQTELRNRMATSQIDR
jgi:hypothetical protein